MKKKKYHRGGAHEDHHVQSRPAPSPRISGRPTPVPRPSRPTPAPMMPAQQVQPPPNLVRLPSQNRNRPRPGPLMRPTQTGRMSPEAEAMRRQALQQARAEAEKRRRMSAENDAFSRQLQDFRSGKRGIEKGSPLDNARRNQDRARFQQALGERIQLGSNRTREEQAALANNQLRIEGTGRRVNPNAGRRRTRRRR